MTFSIICPVYNEITSIESLLTYFKSITPKPREIFLVDGNSTDGTRNLIEKFSLTNDIIFLLDNPFRTVPYALNLAIPRCTGDIIVRLDAHTEYSNDYFSSVLDTFAHIDADIVGGPMRTIATDLVQQSVAYSTSVGFGIGDSSFHFAEFRGYTSTVYLGAWKKEIFSKIGYFDTRFKRNQDDEFHYRANQFGLKIYQSPDIKLWYHPRNSLFKLFSQYFQYGLYKPMVLFKIKSGMRIRHLVPSFFVFYLLLLVALPFFHLIFFLPLGLYLFLDILFSFNNQLNIFTKLTNIITFPILHLSYGSGMIIGIFKLIRFDKPSN